jgi:hypothetical protein
MSNKLVLIGLATVAFAATTFSAVAPSKAGITGDATGTATSTSGPGGHTGSASMNTNSAATGVGPTSTNSNSAAGVGADFAVFDGRTRATANGVTGTAALGGPSNPLFGGVVFTGPGSSDRRGTADATLTGGNSVITVNSGTTTGTGSSTGSSTGTATVNGATLNANTNGTSSSTPTTATGTQNSTSSFVKP